MTRRKHIASLLLALGIMLVLEGVTFAQARNSSMPGAGTRRAFTLYGDLKVDESQAGDANTNVIFDVILYTRGSEVFQRQRVGNNGRYRFVNVFNGDYYLAVELDSVELVRMPVLISENAVEQIKQDLEFRWKGAARATTGVVSKGPRDSSEDLSCRHRTYEPWRRGKFRVTAVHQVLPDEAELGAFAEAPAKPAVHSHITGSLGVFQPLYPRQRLIPLQISPEIDL